MKSHFTSLILKFFKALLQAPTADLLTKCRTLVGTFKHSTSLSYKLRDVIKSGGDFNKVAEVVDIGVEHDVLFIDDELEEPVMQETIDENVDVTAEDMLQSSKSTAIR